MLSSAVVAVTPSKIFNSAAVAVTPSKIFNSAAVAVTAVPAIDSVLGLVPISITVPPESSEYSRLLVRSNAGSPWTRSLAKGAPDPFFSLIVVAITYSKKNKQKEKGAEAPRRIRQMVLPVQNRPLGDTPEHRKGCLRYIA